MVALYYAIFGYLKIKIMDIKTGHRNTIVLLRSYIDR